MNDLWNYLKSTAKPILLYGMGNGAEKILDVCEAYGIKIQAIFASDGFAKNKIFRGYTVRSMSETIINYENPIILLGFGTHIPEMLEFLNSLSERYEVYAPDVPVVDGELFNSEFYERNLEKIKLARELFNDERSKKLYDEIISFKLDGKINHMLFSYDDENEVLKRLCHIENVKYFADLGAYNGDTIRQITAYGAKLKKAYAVEPDIKTFRKLKNYTDTLDFEVVPVNACVGKDNGKVLFGCEGNRGSALSKNVKQTKLCEIEQKTLDGIICDNPLDYIKYDVEGEEKNALLGSRSTINKNCPLLCISLYHRSGDLFELPLLVNELFPFYKMYLRRWQGIPAWDINLFCIKKDSSRIYGE